MICWLLSPHCRSSISIESYYASQPPCIQTVGPRRVAQLDLETNESQAAVKPASSRRAEIYSHFVSVLDVRFFIHYISTMTYL